MIVPNAKANSTSLKEMGIIGTGSGKTWSLLKKPLCAVLARH
jgi:hypothetical protein